MYKKISREEACLFRGLDVVWYEDYEDTMWKWRWDLDESSNPLRFDVQFYLLVEDEESTECDLSAKHDHRSEAGE